MTTDPTTPNVLSLTRTNHSVRSTDLSTKRDAARVLASAPSAHVIAIAAAVLVGGRLWGGHFDLGVAAAPIVTVALVGLVEWTVHRTVLHAARASWTDRWFGLAGAHRRHHHTPAELRWLMLSGVEAAIAVLALGAVSALWAAPVALVLGASVPGTLLTAWACAVLGLGHYEWVHLLNHSSYQPRTHHYARVASNHRRHHQVDEHHWLGITACSGDRLMRTAPAAAHASAGPLATSNAPATSISPATSPLSSH